MKRLTASAHSERQQRLELEIERRRRFYSVTETCRRLRIKPHVLRYWEREFGIALKRNSAGRRIVSETQIQKLEYVRHLLHDEKLTIRGARRRLDQSRASPQTGDADPRVLLSWVRQELGALKALLGPEEPAASATSHF